MNTSSLQLLGSRLTPQQLLVMVNAQIAANAKGNAATQSNAQIQSGTAAQAQAGGQYSGMAQNQGVAKSPSKGKARVKKAKFNNIAVNSNNDGAEAQDPTKPKKATRPLNSFIAFRSYYSKTFKGFQQKNISGFLTALWKADPFQAKWAILAKGFSEIRDVKGKSDALLPEFLSINAPLLRIIEPERYLMALGWNLTLDAEAQMVLRREPNFDAASIGTDLLTTNVSVAEVIENCYQHDYIARDSNVVNPSSNGQVMIMASSAQPATPANMTGANVAPATDHNDHSSLHQQKNDDSIGYINDIGIADENVGVTDGDANTSASVFMDMSSTFGTSDTQLSEDGANVVNNTQATMFNNAPADIDFNMVDGHIGTYPHNLAFDPLSTNDGYMFDPFQGHGFDSFNLSSVNQLTMDDWMLAPTAFGSELEDDFFNF